MNPTNNSTSTKHSVLESAGSDEKFTKVFNKFSTFSGWADSSSDEDLYEGAELENCSESAVAMSEKQSVKKVPTSAANAHQTCNSDDASETAHSLNEDMNDSADEGNISYKHPGSLHRKKSYNFFFCNVLITALCVCMCLVVSSFRC